ncbi:MAG: hypothetical protein PHU12_01985 [Candidatus Aenigmarchaeota archaeon]|nr:hypothetical protein [Candidatus Aenigmarchaeota archaeon]
MKGQFFIISTVIMISALILIMGYLYDYGKVDLTKIETGQEINLIEDIQNSLKTTVKAACDSSNDDTTILENNILLEEKFLKDKMLESGIVLEITHNTPSCASTQFTFKIKSNDFYIENTFTYQR